MRYLFRLVLTETQWIILLLACLAPKVSAEVKIYGSTKYQFSDGNRQVTFGCGGINNPSSENTTGTIKLQLWALDRPYNGGGISGKILAEYKLEGLKPKAYYSPLSRTVAVTSPSVKRRYYLCLTAMEYRAGGYVVSSYRNFDEPVVLGPQKLFTLAGPWSWRTSSEGGTVEINVAKISHTRTGATGTLKLAVWATKKPYNGGAINGFEIGSVIKKALQPGYNYTDVKNTGKYVKPPSGSYFVHILLLEYQDGEYKTVAYLTSGNTTKFD